MSSPGTLTAALAFVPGWWQETTDPTALDTLLAEWARVCGWKACGFVWQGGDGPAVVRGARPAEGVSAETPPEVPDALRRLRGGEETVYYSLPNSGGRVFAPVQPPGKPAGLVWAEKPAGQSWLDTDRAYLALTGRAMEKSPVVAAVVGPVLDPDRLFQRLGDAAVIAGRMAHDFDNILTGIIGFSDLTLPMLQPGTQPAGFVAEIAKVGQRGIQFTQQLHQLSRSGQVKPSPGAVAAAVAKEEVRLKPLAGAGVRFDREIPAGLPGVALDPAPLQVVLGHLMENAVEACPQGGVVRVTARTAELSEAEARAYLGKAAAGPHLLVAVTDTGVGIKPEVRRRLFAEPFFTTKVRHRGLGLAIVYRVVCAHRGGIQFDPVPPPGTGTTVRVVLPLAATRPPAAAGGAAGRPAPGGTISTTAVGG